MAMRQRRLLLVVTAALIALAGVPASAHPWGPGTSDAAVIAAASSVYSSVNVTIHPFADAAFTAAFPDHELYVVLVWSMIPPKEHAMGFHRASGLGFDVTRDFNTLVASRGAALTSADQVMTLAKAYAQIGHSEMPLPRRTAVGANSSELGMTISDPQVTQRSDGWDARITTWSVQNGLVLNWTLAFDLTGISTAEMQVGALARGQYAPSWEAPNYDARLRLHATHVPTYNRTFLRDMPSGTYVVQDNLDGSSIWPVLATRTNFDGTIWRVNGERSMPAEFSAENFTQFAEDVANAAAEMYARFVKRSTAACAGVVNPNPNWGFEAADPDCIMEITIFEPAFFICNACIYEGDDVNIYVTITARPTLAALGTMSMSSSTPNRTSCGS